MTNYHFFVTGTDTDVGKTFVSLALLQAAQQKKLVTGALKPVAAGCESTPLGLQNADALALQKYSSMILPYETVNPVTLEAAIAPHIAAQQERVLLSVEQLKTHCQETLDTLPFAIVEGAGGWLVPLNDSETLADLAKQLTLPVILVVGMRLGCINHALLTARTIESDGLVLAGWVANQVDPDMPVLQENISSLRQRIAAPYLGHIPFMHNTSVIDAAKYVDIDKLLA